MGDRANIVIREDSSELHSHEAVFLYSHWGGTDLPEALKEALDRGTSRHDDAPYLARIIFNSMVNGDHDNTTGLGISTRLTDNEHPLLVLDMKRQVVVELSEEEYNEHGFAKLAEHEGEPFAGYPGKWKDDADDESEDDDT